MKKGMIVLCYLPALIGFVMYEQAMAVNLFIGFVCFIMGIVFIAVIMYIFMFVIEYFIKRSQLKNESILLVGG